MKQFFDPRLVFSHRDFVVQFSFITSLVLLLFSAQDARSQIFMDHAPLWGIDEVLVQSSDHWGSGLSFYDIDGDGWDDLTYTNDGVPIRIFKNTGGQYEEVSHNIPNLGAVKEVAWFDIDNDGIMELLISAKSGKYQLFKHNGDFQFEDISVQAGLHQNQNEHYGVAIGDYNRDGFLDFYVCVYSNENMEDNFWTNNHLYRNNRDGTFTDVTLEAGVGDGIGSTFDAAWMDYNVDGWPDLYVINDRQPYPNKMYRNNGDGTFTDVAESINVDFSGQNPMTATIGDYDNDGAMDIYLTNVGYQLQSELLRNDGTGNYTNAGSATGVAHNLYSWGSLWIDFDNDGFRDLYVATSPIMLPLPVFNDILYKNNGGQLFDMATYLLQDVQAQRNYGVAMGDVDNNGYPDIATQTVMPYTPNVWVNSGGNHNYVKITLTGTASNSMAIGSWIKVYANGQQYTHYTNCGQNYVSQDSQHVLFGLEQSQKIDSLHVEYLSGHIDTYYDLDVNMRHHFKEGETHQVDILVQGDLNFCQGGEVTLDAGHYFQFLWSNGDTTQTITVSEPGNYAVTAYNEFGVAVYSEVVEVVVYPLPIIDYSLSEPACAGDNTGSIVLENIASGGIAITDWETGHNGFALDSLLAGEYHYTVVDSNGCTASGDVFLQEPLPLSVQVFVFPEFQGDDGSIFLVVNGGVPSYQAFLDTVEYPLDGMTNLSGGTYLLTVIDSHNCSEAGEVTVESVTSVGEIEDNRLAIYPNPVKEMLYLKAAQTIEEVQVFDAAGRLCLSLSDRDIRNIDVSGLSKGQYAIHLLDVAGNVYTDSFTKL